eukprot:scaffold88614_cov30-Phaeocystis_antarctica.AAC.2
MRHVCHAGLAPSTSRPRTSRARTSRARTLDEQTGSRAGLGLLLTRLSLALDQAPRRCASSWPPPKQRCCYP